MIQPIRFASPPALRYRTMPPVRQWSRKDTVQTMEYLSLLTLMLFVLKGISR